MMNKLLLIAALLLLSGMNLQAQDEKKEIQTLYRSGRPLGFYIGWSTKPSLLNQQFGILTGGELALSLGRKINIGFAAYGLVSPIKSNLIDADGRPYYYDLAYGGFLFEPIIGSVKVIHLTFPIVIGAGGVGYHQSNVNWETAYDNFEAGAFLFAEPGIRMEVNVFKCLRFNMGVSYRFTTSGYLSRPYAGELDGFSASVGLKFGIF